LDEEMNGSKVITAGTNFVAFTYLEQHKNQQFNLVVLSLYNSRRGYKLIKFHGKRA
jgi:hypothetical protein